MQDIDTESINMTFMMKKIDTTIFYNFLLSCMVFHLTIFYMDFRQYNNSFNQLTAKIFLSTVKESEYCFVHVFKFRFLFWNGICSLLIQFM